ncbi:MAG: hypothetical protein QOG64_261, partial [Acidimicrobiaceae bacterium]|nr:hypothetical protein [Acidimicrobiaceae bacterium]
IDLSWTAGTPAGTAWEVDHSIDASFSSSVTVDTTNLPTGQTTFQKTGLASGTTFYFRVRALAGATNSSWSNVAGAVTTSPPAPVCAIGTANVTPAAVNKSNNGNDALSSDLYVSVHTSGVCTGLRLRFTSAVGAAQANRPLVQRTGGVWDDTIDNAAYGWDTGNKTLLVTDSSGSPLASIALLVCAKGNSCP